MNRSVGLLGVAMFLTSCNVSESLQATSSNTVAIAPRIATAQGVSLPVTDSVYIKVSSSDPAKIWYEKALPWSSKFVVVSGLPRGVAFTVVMEGREAHGNGGSSAWWRGAQSGTASTAQTVSAQTLPVPVQVLYSPAPWKDSLPYGTLLDARDGQSYRSVVIGGRRWMAENLNYRPAGADSGWCYDNQGGNCAKYGRLYTWSQTMVGAASSNTVPSGVRGICPEGWHVPSDGEWADLAGTVAALPGVGTANAGTALKSLGGWEPTSANGTDVLGFRFLPAGNRGANGAFNALLGSGTIASATEASPTMALNRAVQTSMTSIYNNSSGEPKGLGLSVRCVQDYQPSVVNDSGAFSQDASTLGLWRFDEGAGTSVVDRVSGKAGTLSGGVSWVPGRSGKAVKFDGSTGFADLNFDPPESNVSFEMIVNIQRDTGWLFTLWGANNSGVALGSKETVLPYFGSAGSGLPLGQDLYLALTVDGTRSSKLFVNGRMIASGTASEGYTWSSLVLASYTGSAGFVEGVFSEFRVTTGNLEPAAIQAKARSLGFDSTVVQSSGAIPSGNVGMRGLASRNGFANSCTLWPSNSPYTIEFWVKPTGREASAGFGSYQDLGETRTLNYFNLSTGDTRFRRLQASGWWSFHPDLNLLRAGDGDTLPTGQWGHAAFVYTGSQGVLYLNGTERARVADSRGMECGSSVSLAVNAYNAEIDNIRVSRIARYAQNFAPPTSYGADSATIYRWTFDGPLADRLKDEVNGVVLASATDSVVSWVGR